MEAPPNCLGTGVIFVGHLAAEACCDDCPYAAKCMEASAPKVPARRWLVEQLYSGVVHVVPIDDAKPHSKTLDCACGWHLVLEGHGVIVHKAYDGRIN